MSPILKMYTEELKLRILDASDMEDLYSWRNHPLVRKKSFRSDPLSWEEHQRWFKRKSESPDTTIYIGYYQGNKVGMIRFDNGSESIKVSVMMSPDFMGRNLGSKLIQLGVKTIMETKGLGRIITAEIKKNNIASIKAFEKAGFKMSHLTYTLGL